MEIISVNKENKQMVMNFLNELAIINDVNEDVVLNGEFVYEEDKIIGFLSFEEFNKIGLIRYFIFKKVVEPEVVKELFHKLNIKAKEKGIDNLITLVVKEEAVKVFQELGFDFVDKSDVYIEEVKITDTRFKDAIVLKYKIQK